MPRMDRLDGYRNKAERQTPIPSPPPQPTNDSEERFPYSSTKDWQMYPNPSPASSMVVGTTQPDTSVLSLEEEDFLLKISAEDKKLLLSSENCLQIQDHLKC